MTTEFDEPFARAGSGELIAAAFKTLATDFRVSETLPFAPDGAGPHWLLLVEKDELNTLDLLNEVARALRIPRKTMGYSGLKDRFAVTRQWLTIPAQAVSEAQLEAAQGAHWRVLEWHRHKRKLRVGSHRLNHFEVVLREVPEAAGLRQQVDERLQQIGVRGVPNYFGPQRFGNSGNNLRKALQLFVEKKKLARQQHRFSVSAARSFLFNACLSQRVSQGQWDSFIPGDLVILDGSNSWFELDRLGDDGEARLRAHDIHPSGPMWGQGAPATGAAAAELEQACGRAFADIATGLADLGLKQERRALRLNVHALEWQWSEAELSLSFALARGGFATTVLSEIVSHPLLSFAVPDVLRTGIAQLASNT